MPNRSNRSIKTQLARRHFLGIAAAAGARLAAVTGAAGAITAPSDANSMGRNWGKHRGKGKHGSNCFLRGTTLSTSTGEVKVEELSIGDLITTLHGEAMPIRWIGRRNYKSTHYPTAGNVMPIRIRRHALDGQVPHSDLYLSPGHALLVDGVLIRVMDLVNGASIAPALPQGTDTIEYFHILLDGHQVILAQGAPTETLLLEGQNDEHFANFAELRQLFPGIFDTPMKPAAPIVGYGGKKHLKALLRIAASLVVRNDVIYDDYEKIAARAFFVAHRELFHEEAPL
ncbi:Hint domain-containing protein [Pararhizobium sp. DWP3-4]|uniref:Hint domain-containing protein n=1 Tax=Pararhizobium sp. DWP3-4 TaxID=2804565 RepID=UPI003CF4F70B